MADADELADAGDLSLFADSTLSGAHPAREARSPEDESSIPVLEIPIATSDVASEPSRSGVVPPPLTSDIDALLEAVSLAGRSPGQKSAGELRVAGAASPPVCVSSTLFFWRPAIIRCVAPSVAAFLVGAMGALWGLRALPPTSRALLENVVTTPDVATTSGSSQLDTADPLPPHLPPVPTTPLMREVSPEAVQQIPETRIAMPPPTTDGTAATHLASESALTVSSNPGSITSTEVSSGPALATGAMTRGSGAAPPALESVSGSRTSTLEALSLTRLVAAPATDLEPLSIGALVISQPAVALSAAPPDPTPEVAEDAPTIAAPALVITELAPSTAAPDAPVEEEHAVRRTLHSYEEAYEELDVTAAAEVWPSVDRRALSRAFATLKSQGLDFHSCEITVGDSQATAYCYGTLQVVRKVGSPVPVRADQHWVFKMRRQAGTWKIDDVSASQAPVIAARRFRGQG